MKAVWHNQVIAESNATVVLENNHYFPAESVNHTYLQPGDKITHCPWKGEASYCDIRVGSETNKNAVWYYPQPKDAAREIKGHYAFWKGVAVRD